MQKESRTEGPPVHGVHGGPQGRGPPQDQALERFPQASLQWGDGGGGRGEVHEARESSTCLCGAGVVQLECGCDVEELQATVLHASRAGAS